METGQDSGHWTVVVVGGMTYLLEHNEYNQHCLPTSLPHPVPLSNVSPNLPMPKYIKDNSTTHYTLVQGSFSRFPLPHLIIYYCGRFQYLIPLLNDAVKQRKCHDKIRKLENSNGFKYLKVSLLKL